MSDFMPPALLRTFSTLCGWHSEGPPAAVETLAEQTLELKGKSLASQILSNQPNQTNMEYRR